MSHSAPSNMEVTKPNIAATDAVHNADAFERIGTGATTLGSNDTEEITQVVTRNDADGKPKSLDEPFRTRDTAVESGAKPEQYTSEKPVMVTRLDRLGEEPALIDCPFCKECKQTRIERNDSSQTTLAAAFCCLCCGIITVCIPSLCHWCADIDHYCSGCGSQVAHKPHEGKVEVKSPQDKTKEVSMYAKPGQEVSKYAHPTQEDKTYVPHSVEWKRNEAAKASKLQAA